jgi:hypothetical protein
LGHGGLGPPLDVGQAGRLKTSEILSARFTWMAAKETDEFINRPTTFIEEDGASLKAALDITRKYGAVVDAILPFTTGALYPNPAKTFYALAAQYKISSYFNLGEQSGKLAHLAGHQGPDLDSAGSGRHWDNANQTGGVLDVYQPPTRGGHAVALVGCDTTSFLVRNSWGTSWGNKGFAHASWSYAQAAFTEAYGMSL